MAKKKNDGYLSAKESRRISKENRKITAEYEKKYKRKNVPESEYLTTMKNPANALEVDGLRTYFFTDIGTSKAVDGVSFDVPQGFTPAAYLRHLCGSRGLWLRSSHRSSPDIRLRRCPWLPHSPGSCRSP